MTLCLPSTSFVPVVTQRLRAPQVIWTMGGSFNSTWAVDNAFCIRQISEPRDAYLVEERIQQADRYGGHGVGYGGGSGRCATFGIVQVKGVGRTPLVTRRHDIFHENGLIWMREAAYEVIWSQIFAVILPYGVVPHLAIIAAGDGTSPQVGEVRWKRTLLMREFTLRSAHFMRNTNFDNNVGSDGLCLDASRARTAIRAIHLGFEHVFGKQVAGTDCIAQVNLGLRIMAKRFAAQVAASFAKRLFHGALSCSNIALDGRFMDFGVATYVASYRRRAKQIGSADQWTQDRRLLRTLHLLQFHIKKYFPDNAKRLLSEAELTAEFEIALAGSMELEMLKMTGVPQDFASNYPPIERQRLFKCMRDIYSRDADEVFLKHAGSLETVGSNPPPDKYGRYDLNAILALASTCSNADELAQTLGESLGEAKLRQEFVACYAAFVDAFVYSFDADSRHVARVYVAMQANRLNADLSFLKREILLREKLALLDKEPGVFEANLGGLSDFILATVQRGKYFLQQDHPDLSGEDALQQVATLQGLGTQLPDFVMNCLTTAAASPAAKAGMNKLLSGGCTPCAIQ